MAAYHSVLVVSMHLRSVRLKMFYIVLYITTTTAQTVPGPACTTVTWEDKVCTKLDTVQKLPEECTPDLVFLDDVGKGFCLEADPVKETS